MSLPFQDTIPRPVLSGEVPRALDIERVCGLFRCLREAAGLEEPAYSTLEEGVLERLRREAPRYSALLEFSLGLTRAGVSVYRFSYSFPNLDAAAFSEAAASIRAWSAPFGEGTREVTERLLSAATPDVVPQLLVGLDAAPGSWRWKLYFQFRPGQATDKLRLLSRVLPPATLRRLSAVYAHLHLVGFDITPRGLLGVKLYFLRPPAAARAWQTAYPTCGFLRRVFAPAAPLSDMLEIWRIDRERAVCVRADELDFGLSVNGATWADVERFAAASGLGEGLAAWRAVTEGFRLGLTRLSVSAARDDKLNLYYVPLDIAEPH